MAVVVNGDGKSRPPGTFGPFDGQIIRWNGATWKPIGTNAAMKIVVPRQDPVFTGQIWCWDLLSNWTRLLRSTDIMASGVGSPDGSVEGWRGQTYLDGTGNIYINYNGSTGWVMIYEVPV
jgi:hypothetical protein